MTDLGYPDTTAAREEGVFDIDTRSEPVGGTRRSAWLSGRWCIRPGTPNGGYLLAICVRALADAAPHPDPLAVSGFFLRPGQVADAEVDTEMLREGTRMSTGESRLRQQGRDIVHAVATFTDLALATGRTEVLSQPPALPAPERCVSPTSGMDLNGATIAERVDVRFAEQPGWRHGRTDGTPTAEFWMRFADGAPADVLALPLLVDAAPPAVWELGELQSSTVELTLHVRQRPEPGWLACRASTRNLLNGFHEEDFEIWDSRGVLVAQSRQLALV
ncbi:Acyl-CoA thioesterase [Haloechinothrix alba]|uniref:Acyl-CoA thioesterase n=1 Tax=Haloechinothrix alba TaxID=664784 RepID=A0A238V199_9PSEU|nr:thioesterase family protein [Haloechinothrix alba]SNR28046.1 Acyl-CoA thioesterase [Haloechinothrix alba]